MPERPDLEVYIHALRPRVVGQALEAVRVVSPFVLRSVDPSVAVVQGLTVRGHAENEVNYCATCQTGGRLLAARALSWLLKADWLRSLEELERMTGGSH
jgi:hypothetical protein